MSSFNRVTLVGRVGQEPELKFSPDRRECYSFSVATGERWKDKLTNEWKETVNWHNVVSWNEHLNKLIARSGPMKGKRILVEGALSYRRWQDKDGHDRVTTYVVLNAFSGVLLVLDEKKSQSPQSPQSPVDEPIIEDEIPF